MADLISLLVQRLVKSVSTPLTIAHLPSGMLCLLLGLGLIPIGWQIGFLRVQPVRDRSTIVRIAALALIFPALTEELSFRVLPLPHPSEAAAPGAIARAVLVGLVVFVLYHPLNALTVYAEGRKTFFDSRFLLLAGLLGGVCSVAYLQTGSLWLPVGLHWLAVAVWVLLLGGYARLYGEEGREERDAAAHD